MKKRYIKMTGFFAGLLACALLTGCGDKETDPAAEQVLEITITPAATPTPAPEELNPAAVTEKDGITMVNGYLEQQGASSAGTAAQPDASGTEEDGAQETDQTEETSGGEDSEG